MCVSPHRSPTWVIVLDMNIHAALWLALYAVLYYSVLQLPTVERIYRDFSLRLPAITDDWFQFVLFWRWSWWFPPALDMAVLVVLHRYLGKPVLRLLWSLVVVVGLLGGLVYTTLAVWLIVVKLGHAFFGQPIRP